jgi:hypothetical protein
MTTLNFLPTPRLATLLAALALTACELPAKVGDLPDTDTAAETGETGDTTDGETDGETVSEPNPTVGDTITGASSDSGDDPSDSSPGNPTAEPPACFDLSEEQCQDDPGCASLYGEQYGEGCMGGTQVFLLCYSVGLECDDAESTVCDEQSAYKIPMTCDYLPGLEVCGPPMCGVPCEGLDEASCEADEACKPVHGNPHVPFDDVMCVDSNTIAYLGCLEDTGECPPFIPTVCPENAPDEFYDVTSGCIPPHFVQCGEGGTPSCP